MYEINNYLTESEQDPYAKWLFKLPDRQAKARVIVRVDRMSTGNFGDVKPLGDGVWEARIDWGPGTGCTTQSRARKSSCFCLVEISVSKMLTC
jgi:putative addiction module killer protein